MIYYFYIYIFKKKEKYSAWNEGQPKKKFGASKKLESLVQMA
jgi:hypothetical protein